MDILQILFNWFEKNIGFLNNRKFEIDSSPYPDGGIHINVEYYCFDFVERNLQFPDHLRDQP